MPNGPPCINLYPHTERQPISPQMCKRVINIF